MAWAELSGTTIAQMFMLSTATSCSPLAGYTGLMLYAEDVSVGAARCTSQAAHSHLGQTLYNRPASLPTSPCTATCAEYVTVNGWITMEATFHLLHSDLSAHFPDDCIALTRTQTQHSHTNSKFFTAQITPRRQQCLLLQLLLCGASWPCLYGVISSLDKSALTPNPP
jgi:hypothetical protein